MNDQENDYRFIRKTALEPCPTQLLFFHFQYLRYDICIKLKLGFRFRLIFRPDTVSSPAFVRE